MKPNPTIAAAAERLIDAWEAKAAASERQGRGGSAAEAAAYQACAEQLRACLASHRGDDGTEEIYVVCEGDPACVTVHRDLRDAGKAMESWPDMKLRILKRQLASALNIELKNPAEQNEPREGREGK